MTTPTILSDVGSQGTKGARVDRSGAMRSQKAVATIPATTAATTIIGMIPFQKGFTLESFQLKTDDLDTGTTVTLNVGYVYTDNVSFTDAPAAFISANAIAQTGTSLIYPIAAGLLTGTPFIAAGDGYVVLQVQAGPTTTAGTATLNAQFTYDA